MLYYIIKSLPPSPRKKKREKKKKKTVVILHLSDISGGKDVGEEIWRLFIFFSS